MPRITADQIIKAIKKLGFEKTRQKGSHRIFKKAEGIRIVIPFHSGKIIHPKILKTILADCKITIKELKKLIKLF